MATAGELFRRLLATFLVVSITIMLGARYRIGGAPTALLASAAGFLANFFVPSDEVAR
jgi:hypothetical protein